MTDQIFGHHYATQYDAIYQEKDYEEECDLLEAAFARFASAPARSVLDLGCGTGSHVIPLARRGYEATGVDRSKEMLELAKHKAASHLIAGTDGRAPSFVHGDIRSFEQARQYDAVLMLFAVLGYQVSNDDVIAALRTARRHVRSGGLFLCDVWYGPAVLALRPTDRIKRIRTKTGQLIRHASTNLDIPSQTAQVRLETWEWSGSSDLIETTEIHEMRFFFSQELALFMKLAGFEMVSLTAMPSLEKPASENTWNVFTVGRAV